MPSTQRCPRCSAVLPVTAEFCRRCGAAQQGAVKAAAFSPSPQPVYSIPLPMPVLTAPRPNHRVPIIVGFFFVIFMGLIILIRSTAVSVPDVMSVSAPAYQTRTYQSPVVNYQTVQAPQIQMPQIVIPQNRSVQFPQFQAPQIQIPEIHVPTFPTPSFPTIHNQTTFTNPAENHIYESHGPTGRR